MESSYPHRLQVIRMKLAVDQSLSRRLHFSGETDQGEFGSARFPGEPDGLVDFCIQKQKKTHPSRMRFFHLV